MSNTESFESVLTYAQAVMSECDMPLLDRLQAAHDREVAQSLKDTYAYGYADGRRSMDAEHEHVALRLRRLTFDGGSHESLSRIAYAVYPCATGWTPESCAGLRDRLIDLLGGVYEHPYPTSTYDVLGNERHKAVCELRKIHTDAGGFVKALAKALGVEWQAPRVHQTLANVRDRLIHLLGGDESDFTEIAKTINLDGKHDGELMENGENHKMATITDEPTLSDLWGVWKDDDGTCPNDDGTCPNDDPLLSITDELRKYVAEIWDGSMYVNRVPMELRAIADRIDEQFDRICAQQEAVLQSIVDGAEQRLKDADKQRDELTHDVEMWRDRAEDMRASIDALETKLCQLVNTLGDSGIQAMWVNDGRDCIIETSAFTEPFRVDYRAATSKCDELRRERDDLQAKLDSIRDALDA